MIYLASPYSHPLPEIRQERYEAVHRHVLRRMQTGLTLISPICYGHQFSRSVAWDAASWQHFNYELFLACDSLEVLKLPGWEESVGVRLEIDWAEKAWYKINYMEPLA